jgi:uncharacterized protein YecT (DUF1311 family)
MEISGAWSPFARRLVMAAGMGAAIAAGVSWALMTAPQPPSPPGPPRAAPAIPAPAPELSQLPPLRLRPVAPPMTERPPRPRPGELRQAREVRPAPPVARSAHVRAAAPRPPAACRAPQSPADRLVCARPALAAQDREMRRAYDRALAAGADRLAIDAGQARWRGRRDRTTSEADLARLYARRIAELDAAARARRRP